MPERGPHDDFETAERLIRAAYVDFAANEDLEEIREKYVSDDLEYVTRDGAFHGREWYGHDFEVQLLKWRFESEVKEIIDAGEGAVIVMIELRRIDRESGEVAWKVWPASVMRVHDGRLVFFEGYIDSRKAMAALGVERG